jgi:hypothetical protein
MTWQMQIALWLAACSFVVPGVLGEEPAVRPKVKIEFRWLEAKPISGVTEVKGIHTSERDELSYPHMKPILTNEDVVEVGVSKIEFNKSTGLGSELFTLHFHLTKKAHEKLAANCGETGDKMLAAFIDGTYRGAPYYLRSRDESSFVPYAGGLTLKADVERIVEAFK